MKLNHINLAVSDVAETTLFFETYFNFICTDRKGENVISVLKGEDGFTLVVMANKEGIPVYPGAFHIGFMLHSMEAVKEVYEKLKAGNITLEQEPRKIRDSFGFYFTFDNLMIEVGHYL